MDKISFPVSIVDQIYLYSTSWGVTNFFPNIFKMQSLLTKRIRCIYPGIIANLSGSLKEVGF